MPIGVNNLEIDCFNCLASYTLTRTSEGQIRMTPHQHEIACANADCRHIIIVLRREISRGELGPAKMPWAQRIPPRSRAFWGRLIRAPEHPSNHLSLILDGKSRSSAGLFVPCPDKRQPLLRPLVYPYPPQPLTGMVRRCPTMRSGDLRSRWQCLIRDLVHHEPLRHCFRLLRRW